jgi:hypothetical protein
MNTKFRTITTIFLFIILICFMIILYHYNMLGVLNVENNNSKTLDMIELNTSQKLMAINIATNDIVVKNNIDTYIYDPSKTPHTTYIYQIGNVTINKFLEIAPGLNNTKELPAVELITGNKSEQGTNLYVFVDLERDRVAYIGFLNRSQNGSFNISNNHQNITIVDNGYVPGRNLTDVQKSMIVKIALNNLTVNSYINGYQYDIIDPIISYGEYDYPYRYIVPYPAVQIETKSNLTNNINYFIIVKVDLKNNSVIDIIHESVLPSLK